MPKIRRRSPRHKGGGGVTRIGSLCSGYLGLDMGLQAVVGGETVWCADLDPGASKILAHRTTAPNLGDITVTDWTTVPPVDWMTAGFPCQPASTAGRRAGMLDERWLWDAVARAIQGVRPRRVLLENVPGLLTVDGGRAFERVICDLAALGYVGRYGVVRASDAGSPHRRARLFVVAATCADGHADVPDVQGQQQQGAGQRGTEGPAGGSGGTSPDTPRHGQDERRTEPARLIGRPDAAERGDAVADTDGRGREGGTQQNGQPQRPELSASQRDDADRSAGATVEWGSYGPAIQRWERVLGRPAPPPTAPNGKGGWRLSPAFVEFLMGLPDGWVTDVPGLSRNQQLKALGNGVVPQQAALAVRTLEDLRCSAAGKVKKDRRP